MNSASPGRIRGLSEIAGDYDAVLCDVWGVVHNGIAAFPAACEALTRFRAGGGRVVLVTNAPRPKGPVIAQLGTLGAPADAFDDVVTSGDVTRDLLAALGPKPIHHVGPERDFALYDGLPVRLSSEAEAVAISCTGLFDDDRETPSDYDARLAAWAARGLPMVCANPDIVVERGDRLIWCAGALAERYAAIGGPVSIAGKPHAPIYQVALGRIASLRGRTQASRVLAIGDGVATDVLGAFNQGIDVLFVSAGIHGAEIGNPDDPRVEAVAAFLTGRKLGARAFLPRLSW